MIQSAGIRIPITIVLCGLALLALSITGPGPSGRTTIADTTAPALVSATVDGTALVLTYDRELDGGSSPDNSAFTVHEDGTALTVSGVTVSGTTVTLTLSPAVTTGTVVKVTYTVPGTGPVQDADGNQALALASRNVVNNTSGTLVSNTGQSADGSLQTGVIGNIEYSHAQRFTTGDQRGDYGFTAVAAPLSNVGSQAVPKLTVFTDESGEPGTSLYVLANPSTIVSGSLNTFAAPDGATLEAETSYWVVFENESTGATSDNHYRVVTTDSDAQDAGAASGWSIADDGLRRLRDDGAWNTRSEALRIAVEGIIRPDAGLASLKLEDLDENPVPLFPGFSYRETFYTAYVIPQVYSVTLTAEKSDDGATVEYLDGDGNAITDEDGETGGLQLSIDTGDTEIRVKVTAPDGTTARSYILFVTRLRATPDTLIANVEQPEEKRGGGMLSQRFITGNWAHGYLLSGVEINIRPPSTDVLVRIAPRVAGTEQPDLSDPAKIITLMTPDTAQSTVLYKAPPNTILRKDTSYLAIITNEDGTAEPGGHPSITDYSDEDPSGAPGWHISDWVVQKVAPYNEWRDFQSPYKLSVKGHILASRNTGLSELRVLDGDGNELRLSPTFHPDRPPKTTKYRRTVGRQVSEITIEAQTQHPNAKFIYRTPFWVPIADNNPRKEGHQVGLALGENNIEVYVTAEDGWTWAEHFLEVKRESKNSIATLNNLEMSYTADGTSHTVALTPPFHSGTFSYDAQVPYEARQITIRPTKSDGKASVNYLDQDDNTIPDADTNSQGQQVALDVGENTVNVRVTAQNGTTRRTYTTVIIRAAPKTDATLSALALSHEDGGADTTIATTPEFQTAVQQYTALVEYEIDAATINGAKNDEDATVIYLDEGDSVIADTDSLKEGLQTALEVGENTVNVKVTAQDGETSLTYTVVITREAPSSDATLSSLELTREKDGADAAIPLTPPFSPGRTQYTAVVEYPAAEVTVTSTRSDGASTRVYLDGDDNIITDADGIKPGLQVPLQVGPNTIKVKVTAQDGETVITYSVVVSREAPSSDAALTRLELVHYGRNSSTTLTLTPPFDANTFSYTATAGHNVAKVTLTAVKSHNRALLSYHDENGNTINDADGNTEGFQMALSRGDNTVKVKVTAEDGNTTRTYQVTATRAAAPPPSTPGSADRCREEERDGTIANCVVTRFAVGRVKHDGEYTIDWSEWDQDRPEVTGYTIHIGEMLYRAYYDEHGEVDDAALADVYENCEFQNGSWHCEGRLEKNYLQDWEGDPSRPEQLAANEDRTDWTSALDRPGKHVHQGEFVRWSGDATDQTNEPVHVTYQVKTFEIDLYYFTIHEGNRKGGREVVAVDGSTGFD